MNHLELWKLATDVLLLMALAHLCFQFVRSPRISAASRQLRELEGALRSLIREADGAGRTLNEQLMGRQQALEKLLIDAQLTEQRISQAAQSSYTTNQTEEPRATARYEEPREQPRARTERSSSAQPTRPSAMAEHLSTREPASFPTSQGNSGQPAIEEEEESTITFGGTNIYGEPIAPSAAPAMAATPPEAPMGKARRRAMETYSPLSAKIEKEVRPATKEAAKAPAARSSIEDVYASAEQLLRAGNDLMAVASRTRLPIEEVRALSQMIIGERAVAEANARNAQPAEPEEDPRLGVMAKMKRQTITL
ncbi:MAG: hypothetical protein J0M12_09460 [Deltaproteobacteria bacterium]|nr:hypothetical protein [Deltaproteobacteria bacterium]